MRICGENLYAKHSINYTNLRSYFYGFSIWENDRCLSWDDTLVWFDLLGIVPVETIYGGIYNEKKILESYKPHQQDHEGFVVRNSNSFNYQDFNNNVAKFVRKGHVQTNDHWMHTKIVPNKIKTVGG
jgi:hypothetical protein